MQFKALLTTENQGNYDTKLVTRHIDDLPQGDLLIAVSYSCLNYKDALSTSGHPGITKNFPHTPGVDAVGVVKESCSDKFKVGDSVIVTGHDFGMHTDGGLSEYIRVPAAWAIPLPAGLSPLQTMQLGTAGLTAGLSLLKLEAMGAKPGDNVLVTGATGGVGCLSVALLGKCGYKAIASSGKAQYSDKLIALGASEVIDRKQLSEDSPKALLKPRWQHAIDCVGGDTLVNIFKTLAPGGSVAASGLVASANINATVYPFILRGINLLGIDSVGVSNDMRIAVWQRFANDWQLDLPQGFVTEIGLEQAYAYIQRFKQGDIFGRIVVKIAA
ncbi:YhdH/YhfP family quinone oxidoreductase [Dasania marina]|uniref:YhdH/YhfP family quinone oxidoreductase n=1 Tax=Dasania marina TaxID=471499 RepID=UPI0030D8975A|tara:strand:- start:1645 stop:2631 length:987 start_codon:yes stop_codon:yes gene_type:complete